MFEPPPDGGPFSKIVNGKKYEYCAKFTGAPKGKEYDKWVRHPPPKDCNGTRKKFATTKDKKAHVSKPGAKATKSQKTIARVLKVNAAPIAVAHNHEDTPSDESADDYPEWLTKSDRLEQTKNMKGWDTSDDE